VRPATPDRLSALTRAAAARISGGRQAPLALEERGQVRHADATIEYEVRRSRRRRKTIEIQLRDGVVSVAAPARTSPGEIESVVRKRAAWILKHRAAHAVAPPRRFVSGETVPYLGREVPLLVTPTNRKHAAVTFTGATFEVRAPRFDSPEETRERVVAAFDRWYRVRAERRIADAIERWSPIVGQRPTRVLIRDQRRRWGSCGIDGTLRFNWRLVLAEPALLDYVVVHELAHLLVRDHSAKFWAEVERVMPDHRGRRAALSQAAPSLSL
jgi:hypothetical protein